MRIAITGAGGFLGSEMIRQLSNEGKHDLLAITSKHALKYRKASPANIKTVAPSEALGNPALLEQVDVLINCAFPRNVGGHEVASGMEFIDGIFAVASKAGVPSVINVSSQSVYDQHSPEPANEDSEICADDVYSTAKIASELLLEARCPHAKRTNIRLASLIGSGFDQRVVNKMAARALAEGGIAVSDNGSKFGYLDVRDAASGLLVIADNAEVSAWAQAYNLGPDSSYTLLEIAQTVQMACEDLLGHSVCVDYSEASSSLEPVFSTLDSSLFKKSFKWNCSYSLNDTVRDIVWQIALDKKGALDNVIR